MKTLCACEENKTSETIFMEECIFSKRGILRNMGHSGLTLEDCITKQLFVLFCTGCIAVLLVSLVTQKYLTS